MSGLSSLPARAQSHANPCRARACAFVMCTAVRVGVCPLCRLVVTQDLPALARPCRDTGHVRNTGLKGLCCDKENLCRYPSHLVPAPNPIMTPKFCRDMRPSNLYRDRESSVVIEELWATCTRSRARTRACSAHCCAPCTPALVALLSMCWCAPLRHAVATWQKTLSRRKVQGTMSQQIFSVAIGALKWAVAHSGFLHSQFFSFFSFSFPFQNTTNSV